MLIASTFTFAKAALIYAKPIFCIAIRMTVAGLILLLYYYFFSRKRQVLKKEDRNFFAQIILFHIYFAYVFEAWGLVYITSSKACLLYNLSPLITALFSYFLFKERLTWTQWIGLTIGFAGFLPILIAQAPLEALVGQAYFISLPELFLIVSTISACYGWIIMKKLTNTGGYSPILINGIGMLGGGLLASITSFLWEEAPRIYGAESLGYLDKILPIIPSPEMAGYIMFFWYTLLLIIVGNIISYNLYGYLLSCYSATFLSFAGFTTPLFAALFGWLLLNEHITWYFFSTIIIVSFGISGRTLHMKELFLTITVIFSIYIVIVATLLYFFGERDILDNFSLAMSTLSTGGFIPTSTILDDLLWQEHIVLMGAMILGALPFTFHYAFVRKKFLSPKLGKEVLTYFAILGSATILFVAVSGLEPLESVFYSVSASTTAGLQQESLAGLNGWAHTILIILMFVGGCGFSTAGGLKIFRLFHLKDVKSLVSKIKRESLPTQAKKEVISTIIIIALFPTIAAITGLHLAAIEDVPYQVAFFEAVGVITTGGLSAGVIDTDTHSATKIVLGFLMIFGRLEIIAIIYIFVPKLS